MLVSQRVGYTTILREKVIPSRFLGSSLRISSCPRRTWVIFDFCCIIKTWSRPKAREYGSLQLQLLSFVCALHSHKTIHDQLTEPQYLVFFVGSFSSLTCGFILVIWVSGNRQWHAHHVLGGWGGCVSGDLGKLPSRVGVSVRSNHPAFRSLALKRW